MDHLTSRNRVLRLVGFAGLALVATVLPEPPAEAARMRRPFNVSVGVNYGRDNDGGATGCRDYQCGGYCYDGHGGTDWPLPLGTEVVAVFDGRVTATYNGCANVGYLGNTCGGRCGNYVRMRHADGTDALYCHLRLNHVYVSVGQNVSCGQVLGQSASSGSSTGNHLHLGFYIGGVTRDPFAGSCTQSTSYWVSQGTYPRPIQSTACESVCACTPGATQTQGCGNCGTQSRTCASNCQWGSWSACAGQGPCSPGQAESRDCCDCGTESRSCSSSCQWTGWSTCAGPDPVGSTACDTGELGVCAAGLLRCVEGCLACARLVEPSPEICDNLDNDCNGTVDDGSPTVMGEPPPPWAARLVDLSFPARLDPGERGLGWVVFENVGSTPWRPGDIWLQALAPGEGVGSRLRDEGSWPAHDVVALLSHEVEPGGFAELPFSLRLAADESGAVVERFRLLSPDGEAIRCPASELEVSVAPARATMAQVSPDGPGDTGSLEAVETTPAFSEPYVLGGCQCQARGADSQGFFTLLGVAALFLWLRIRRSRWRGKGAPMVISQGRSSVKARALLVLLLGVFAWAGCVEEVATPPSASPVQGRASAAREAEAAVPSFLPAEPGESPMMTALGTLAPGDRLLDAAADGRRLVGRQRAAPPRTSAWLTFEKARLVTAEGVELELPVKDGVVQEARFAPGAGGPLVFLDRQGRLFVWTPGQGEPRLVDHPVLPGLSFSPDGASLAYVQGDIPDFSLRRYDLGRGQHVTLVAPGPPMALPAWSPDGAHLVVASAREGVPALYRIPASGGSLERLTNQDLTPESFAAGARGVPMPEGNLSPLWLGDAVIFEAEGGIFAVSASQGTLRFSVPGAQLPHPGPRGLVVRRGGPEGAFVRVVVR